MQRLRCSFARASDAAKIGLDHARRAGASQEEARLVDEICSSLLFGPARVDEAITRCEELLARSAKSRVTDAPDFPVAASTLPFRSRVMAIMARAISFFGSVAPLPLAAL